MSDGKKLYFSASGLRWWWVTVFLVGADQLSKWWVVNNLELYERIDVAPVLAIYRTFNTGAAWSFLADAGGWQRWGFSILATGVSIALIVWLRKIVFETHKLLVCGLTLILAGAVGNLIDRVRLGHVIDFVLAHWGNANFPAFNVADACISIGAVFVIFDALTESRRERQAASSNGSSR